MAAAVTYFESSAADRTRYARMVQDLWNTRASFDADWRELAQFLQTRRTRFFAGDRNRGGRRNQSIVDSHGTMAVRTMRSGLHAGLTSPARPWMKLTTPDPSLANHAPVKEWLHEVSQRMLTVFAQSNLYNMLPIVYGDIGVFGTSAMSVISDGPDFFRCYTYPIGSFAVGLDERMQAGTFARKYELSVRQVVKEFGGPRGTQIQPHAMIDWSTISKAVKTKWDKGEYESPVEVTWLVMPNDQQDRSRLESKFAMPFRSCHYEEGIEENLALREGGFKTFPFMVPRWDVTGEDSYGTGCPGIDAIGDVKQLQIMVRNKARMLAKAIDPPLRAPSTLRTQKTSLLPGDITFVDGENAHATLAPIHEVRLEGFQHISADIKELKYQISRAFYEDLFLMLQASDNRLGAERPTAREIEERHEEKLIALGPVLERTNDELLDPLVDRVFQMMADAGLIPDAPPELQGVDLKVEYISILAQAQKLVAVSGLDRLAQTVVAMAPVIPDIVDKFNHNVFMDEMGDVLGVTPKVIRPTEEADQIGAARASAQKEAQDAANAQRLGAAVKSAGDTPMGGDTALAALRQGMGASQVPGQAA